MLNKTPRAKGTKGQLKGDVPKGTKLVGSTKGVIFIKSPYNYP